jgi:hypothetical protein
MCKLAEHAEVNRKSVLGPKPSLTRNGGNGEFFCQESS